MSAFIVDKRHIDALIGFGLTRNPNHRLSWLTNPEETDWRQHEYRKLDLTTADSVGAMLLAECVASVSARYPDDEISDLPGTTCDWHYWAGLSEYKFERTHRVPTPVEVLSLIGCYEYQSCEHEGWDGSEAKRFCEALRHQAISDLPGYSAAPWEWREPSEVA